MDAGIEGSNESNGCFSSISLNPWGWKAFVPKNKWVTPSPTITKVFPGHDARLQSRVSSHQQETVAIEIHFSAEMDCQSIIDSLSFESETQNGWTPQLNPKSVVCTQKRSNLVRFEGEIATSFVFSASVDSVSNRIHTFTVSNPKEIEGKQSTGVSPSSLLPRSSGHSHIPRPSIVACLESASRTIL